MFQFRKVSQDEGQHSEVINQFHTDSGLLLYDFVYPDIFKGRDSHPQAFLFLILIVLVTKSGTVHPASLQDPYQLTVLGDKWSSYTNETRF